MNTLLKEFKNKEALVSYVKQISPWAQGEASPISGGFTKAQNVLDCIDPIQYGYTRNYGDGKVTKLSPYINHGILSLNTVRNHALALSKNPEEILKFIQELSWRDFWQQILAQNPEWAWNDIEPYKTGFVSSDYADILPEDIQKGQTGVACIDHFIHELTTTGYIHNHARMYLASYVVHFRRIKWQAGAKWFLHHLLDGNIASNNFSWQWVASTFSNKPYIFNLENVKKYFSKNIDTNPLSNAILDKTYESLAKILFPKMENTK